MHLGVIMDEKDMNSQRNQVSIFIIIFCIFLMVSLVIPNNVLANTQSEFSKEILLNKPGISYDLSPFEKHIDDGTVKVIEVGEDVFNSDPYDTELQTEGAPAPTSTSGSAPEPEPGMDSPVNVNWPPGVYFIYRSNYDNDLAVVINERKWLVDNTTLTGLSLNLVIPTLAKMTERDWKNVIIELNTSVEINDSLIHLMSDKGYSILGEIINTDDFASLAFEKDEIKIFISTGTFDTNSQNDSRQLRPPIPETIISVEGPLEGFNETIEQEIINMLEFLQINATEWDNASKQEFVKMDSYLIPNVPIDPNTFDWGAAFEKEVEWLIKEKIIYYLNEQDIQQIKNKVDQTSEDLNYIIYYSNNTWLTFEDEDGDQFKEHFALNIPINIEIDKLPENALRVPPIKPETRTDEIPVIVLTAIGGFIVIIVIGIFSFTRLKKIKMLDNLNRKNIFELVKANPGIHFKKILRELDFQPGALSYHLNVLEKGEYIKSIQDGNYRRFYLKILIDAGILAQKKSGRESQCFTTGNVKAYFPDN
jgi:DNA-binding transcriptional ArsR family regulator